MGLLDDLSGTVKGAIYQAGESTAQNVMNSVLQNATGGVQGVLNQLSAGGLGHLVSSWTGSDPNQPISVDQLKGVLNSEHVQQIASQLGLPVDKALAALAEHLPQLASQR